jgi:hypothetical protein
MKPEALQLANAIGISSEHPDFPVMDWQQAVQDGETRDGYWDWVINEMHLERHSWLSLNE